MDDWQILNQPVLFGTTFLHLVNRQNTSKIPHHQTKNRRYHTKSITNLWLFRFCITSSFQTFFVWNNSYRYPSFLQFQQETHGKIAFHLTFLGVGHCCITNILAEKKVPKKTPLENTSSNTCSSKKKTTPPKTNMEPENGPLEKEIPIGNHHFQVPC